MTSPIQYLDLIPVSTIDNTDVNHHAQLTLGMDIASTVTQIGTQIARMQSQAGSDINTNISLAAEALLYTLYITSTIATPDAQSLTPHWSRIRSTPILPDSQTLITRMQGSGSNWAGTYGSLGYYIVHCTVPPYIHSTALVDMAIGQMTSVSLSLQPWVAARTSDLDLNIYNSLFQILSPVTPAVRLLDFLQVWVEPLLTQTVTEPTLLSIQSVLRNYVITSYDLDSWSWKMLHSALSPSIQSAIDEIIGYALRPTAVSDTPEGQWLQSLYGAMPSGSTSDILSDANLFISNLTPPGGFNLLLVGIAADLLNRAVIQLTNSTTITNSVAYELYRAGLLLRRSNLDILVAIGHNLGILSQIQDTLPVQVRSLL
jgi:hypothetical protein